MEIKMGTIIKTLVDKEETEEGVEFIIPKGTLGVVCDIFGEYCLIEFSDSEFMPECVTEYSINEFEEYKD